MTAVELALKLDRILNQESDPEVQRRAVEFVWFDRSGRFTDWSLVRVPKEAIRKAEEVR